jgi:hypothetical protein
VFLVKTAFGIFMRRETLVLRVRRASRKLCVFCVAAPDGIVKFLHPSILMVAFECDMRLMREVFSYTIFTLCSFHFEANDIFMFT